MAGELRISMLIEANAARAKAEVASMREETAALARAGAEAGAGMEAAGDGAAEWGSMVQMLRAAMQPMVAEANALAAAADHLAIAEEAGALSAHEAALAHDMLARQAIELQARMEAAGVTLDGTTAAVRRHDTAVQELIARNTGLSRAEGESIADHLRHGQALDQLRARFDPLFAASRQYELVLHEIAEAERLGAISATVAAAARDRLAQAMSPATAGVDRFGRSNQVAAQFAGQLSYQINDIGMMMALGQSPFMLMMQQGPQVVQVFGQMRLAGVGLGTALSSALGMVINPMSLLTMAVIGFGAAAVQHFGQAEDAAETLTDQMERLRDIESGLDQVRDILALSLGELIEKYGLYAFAVRDAAVALEELRIAQARSELAEGIKNATHEWDRFSARMDASEALAQYQEIERIAKETDWAAVGGGQAPQISIEVEKTIQVIKDLQQQLGVSEADAVRLADAFASVRDAATFDDRLTAMQDLHALMRAIGVSAADLPGPIRDALAQAADLTLEMAALKGKIDNNTSALDAMVAAAPGGGWLAGAISDAATLAGHLWDAAGAAAAAMQARAQAQNQLDQMKIEFSPGGQALMAYGSRAHGGTSSQKALEDRNTPDEPRRRGSGGGGGTSEVETQREALAELRAEQERHIELLRTTDPVQRIILENHEALAGAVGDETKEVVALILERQRLEEIRDRIDEIGRTGDEAFRGLISGAHSFSDALAMVIDKLADMLASDAWDLIWSGGDSGWGGLGEIVGGWLGLADGGKVIGPGGPRDDAVPAWLSNGEFVVNAAATAAHLPLLEAINGGASLSDLLAVLQGGRPIALADGGYIGELTGSRAPASWAQASAGLGAGGGAGGGKMEIGLRLFWDRKKGDWAAEVAGIARSEAEGVFGEGIEAWSAHVLPGRIQEVDASPRVYG